jgi:hypothetical protein
MHSRCERLAKCAEASARRPFHGNLMGLRSNLKPITDHFPEGPRSDFEGKWCAAFVYHCCVSVGYNFPHRHPEPLTCSFAGVRAWLEWSKLPCNEFYFARRNRSFSPRRGDIVIYDRVIDPGPHDHIGVVLNVRKDRLSVAEGNVNNISAVVEREIGQHVRGFVRIPDDYAYEPTKECRRRGIPRA